MQSLTSPFFFLTTMIGEEKGDSDSRIIPASSSSSRCRRTASKLLEWIGLSRCLKGVLSCNLIWCFTLSACPTSNLCMTKTSGMARNFSVILFFPFLWKAGIAKVNGEIVSIFSLDCGWGTIRFQHSPFFSYLVSYSHYPKCQAV